MAAIPWHGVRRAVSSSPRIFALETFWPCSDGWRAARIEEEIVVTQTGHEVITRFPAEELLVAGATYVTVNGPLPTEREDEAAPNKDVVAMIAAAAHWRLHLRHSQLTGDALLDLDATTDDRLAGF